MSATAPKVAHVSKSPEAISFAFTPRERRAALSLSSLYALRMLGLFLILPVFALHAPKMAGGDNVVLVGWALGIYGLTQGILQIPFGIASDRLGRKPVIIAGLALFALGSFVAAATDNIWVAILGRALQGAGAISAAVTAFLADQTRDEVRTKAMALIGASIGLMFAFSLVAGPLLYAAIGMGGIFALTGLLATASIGVVVWVVPEDQPQASASGHHVAKPNPLADLGAALAPELLRLNVGIFCLHLVLMAMFVAVPQMLVSIGGLALSSHWQVYLPTVLASFLVMMPPLSWGERHGKLKLVFLTAIGLLVCAQAGFLWVATSLAAIATLLALFFVAFNVLEACLPSLVSRTAPAHAKGAALGVYNTTQALGLFAGGALGGWLYKTAGTDGIFGLGLALCVIWFAVATGMREPVKKLSTSA